MTLALINKNHEKKKENPFFLTIIRLILVCVLSGIMHGDIIHDYVETYALRLDRDYLPQDYCEIAMLLITN